MANERITGVWARVISSDRFQPIIHAVPGEIQDVAIGEVGQFPQRRILRRRRPRRHLVP
jgi:hypothetical protein